jgi:hypothetical protein
VAQIALIGAVADLDEEDYRLYARDGSDYITVDFSFFAELDDGRRLSTRTVYSEGGNRVGWGVREGRRADLPISQDSIEAMLKMMVWPGAPYDKVWQGVVHRLEAVGVTASIPELFVARFQLEIGTQLREALAE